MRRTRKQKIRAQLRRLNPPSGGVPAPPESDSAVVGLQTRNGGNQSSDTLEHEKLMQHLFALRLTRELADGVTILDYITDMQHEPLFRSIERACQRTIRRVLDRDIIFQYRPFIHA